MRLREFPYPALFALALWFSGIWWLGGLRHWPAATGFVGTILTLIPVWLDLMRRRRAERTRPAEPLDRTGAEFRHWAAERVREALLGYEPVYAGFVFAGVSLIALAFAMDMRGAASE